MCVGGDGILLAFHEDQSGCYLASTEGQSRIRKKNQDT